MSRKDIVFAILGGFFLTNAVLAELIGGKLIYVGDPSWKLGPLGPFMMSVGIVPWPVVFVTTDLINEYYGRRGVRRLSFLAVAMIAYAFVVLWLTQLIPAAPGRVDDESYNKIFGQSQWIIVGSITAFLFAQLIDVFVFHMLRRRTGKAMIWLRATGSTVISQLFDTLIVLYIGLYVPSLWTEHPWTLEQYFSTAATGYTVKLFVAVGLTPLVYLGHWAVEKYLGHKVAEELAESAARGGFFEEAPRGAGS
jgi:hypothetical protein